MLGSSSRMAPHNATVNCPVRRRAGSLAQPGTGYLLECGRKAVESSGLPRSCRLDRAWWRDPLSVVVVVVVPWSFGGLLVFIWRAQRQLNEFRACGGHRRSGTASASVRPVAVRGVLVSAPE